MMSQLLHRKFSPTGTVGMVRELELLSAAGIQQEPWAWGVTTSPQLKLQHNLSQQTNFITSHTISSTH